MKKSQKWKIIWHSLLRKNVTRRNVTRVVPKRLVYNYVENACEDIPFNKVALDMIP